MRIAKDDTVVVISGEDKGKRGRVLAVFGDKGRVLVEGINFIKRHTRMKSRTQPGGILEKEAPVHISNLMVVCPRCGEGTRPRRTKLVEGRRVRVCTNCNEIIGKA